MPKTRRKTAPTAHLSEQMKEVLLWVLNYRKYELGSFASNTDKEFSVWAFRRPHQLGQEVPLDHLVNHDFVPWQPRALIGENPTPSKITALSNTLRRLEERGLLNRYSVGLSKDGLVTRIISGKDANNRTRTTHVNLTHSGFDLASSLSPVSFSIEEYENQKTHREMKDQAEGLRFASALLRREYLKRIAVHGAEAETNAELDAINERLGQLPEWKFTRDALHAWNTINDILLELSNEKEEKH